jgi:hypothetical protein
MFARRSVVFWRIEMRSTSFRILSSITAEKRIGSQGIIGFVFRGGLVGLGCRQRGNDDESLSTSHRDLLFSDRICSNSTAQSQQEACTRSGSAESANGLQARWNGQGD